MLVHSAPKTLAQTVIMFRVDMANRLLTESIARSNKNSHRKLSMTLNCLLVPKILFPMLILLRIFNIYRSLTKSQVSFLFNNQIVKQKKSRPSKQ
jgi:hypothetical protein